MHICIPYATLEPIRDVLYAAVQGDASEPDRALGQADEDADPVGRGRTGGRTRRTRRPRSSNCWPSSPATSSNSTWTKCIEAKVDGVPLLECHYGTSNGKYALKVERLLTGAGTGWMSDALVG